MYNETAKSATLTNKNKINVTIDQVDKSSVSMKVFVVKQYNS